MDAKVIHSLVQARLGSTRLPRKVLMDIAGKTLLERVMERAAQIGPPVTLVIPKDDTELAAYAIDHDWSYCVGPEEDVLERYRLAAVALKAEHIIRVTSDCPFLDVEAAQMTLVEHRIGEHDLTTYHLAEGRGVQVFRVEALRDAALEATAAYRHSPDEWMLANPGGYDVHHVRFSVDTSEDLEVARRRAREVQAWQQ